MLLPEHFARSILPSRSMLEVTTFGRDRGDLTRLLYEQCDFLVALGDDASLAHLGGAARLFGFGSRASGALVSLATPANLTAPRERRRARCYALRTTGLSLASSRIRRGGRRRNCTRLCARAGRSSYRIRRHAAAREAFVASGGGHPATPRARPMAQYRRAIRPAFRGSARCPGRWSSIPRRDLAISPGYRTVTVSAIRDADELASRLAPVSGRLEAFALAAAASARARFLDVLAGAGVTYVCDPGKMQSPPLNWPHGGGAISRFHSFAMSNLRQLFFDHVAQTSGSPIGLEISRAHGSWLYCRDGRRYLDFIAGIGVSALGHGHPAILRALEEQARRHLHVMVYGEYLIESQVKLATQA